MNETVRFIIEFLVACSIALGLVAVYESRKPKGRPKKDAPPAAPQASTAIEPVITKQEERTPPPPEDIPRSSAPPPSAPIRWEYRREYGHDFDWQAVGEDRWELVLAATDLTHGPLGHNEVFIFKRIKIEVT